MLPEIIAEMPADAPPGWHTRTVPNKFPALAPDGPARPWDGSDGGVRPGFGYHEVVIETPRHDADLTTLPVTDLLAAVETWRARMAALSARPGVAAVVLFRNHRRGGGASIDHPHAQLIATGVKPPRLEATNRWGSAQLERTGQCATCALVRAEVDDGRRVVEVGDRFLSLVPFAAEVPYELWLVPRGHAPRFADLGENDIAELAPLLERTLRRLKAVADDPAYNLSVLCPAAEVPAPWDHWLMRIVPKLVTPGGFEVGSGLAINPSRPEDDADRLRAAPATGSP